MFNGTAPLGHELPTNKSNPPFDGPGQCLNHLYGDMKAANATLGESITFNQTAFATGNQWADKGILYVPKNCEQK